MARSTCAKCGNQRFELVENEPDKSQFVLYFVQCTKCGSVVRRNRVLQHRRVAEEDGGQARRTGVAVPGACDARDTR